MVGLAKKVPKFLRTLYELLHCEDSRILAWAADGTCFQVFDIRRLEVEVLPKYFKHNKFTSFQRQLNNFGFRKWTKTRANVCTFSHDTLRRCPPSQLPQMVDSHWHGTPHVITASVCTKRGRAFSADSNVSEASTVDNQLDEECMALLDDQVLPFEVDDEDAGITKKQRADNPASNQEVEDSSWSMGINEPTLGDMDWHWSAVSIDSSLSLDDLDLSTIDPDTEPECIDDWQLEVLVDCLSR